MFGLIAADQNNGLVFTLSVKSLSAFFYHYLPRWSGQVVDNFFCLFAVPERSRSAEGLICESKINEAKSVDTFFSFRGPLYFKILVEPFFSDFVDFSPIDRNKQLQTRRSWDSFPLIICGYFRCLDYFGISIKSLIERPD